MNRLLFGCLPFQNRQTILLVNKVRLIKIKDPLTEDLVSRSWKEEKSNNTIYLYIFIAVDIFAAVGTFWSLFVMWPFPIRFDFLGRSKTLNIIICWCFSRLLVVLISFLFKGDNSIHIILDNVHPIWCCGLLGLE